MGMYQGIGSGDFNIDTYYDPSMSSSFHVNFGIPRGGVGKVTFESLDIFEKWVSDVIKKGREKESKLSKADKDLIEIFRVKKVR